MKLTIARAFSVFALVILSGLALETAASSVALNRLKINGPAYDRIVAAKDLVADILPPPEYVIEAYLETQLAMRQPEKLNEHIERLKKLEADYIERRNYWEKSGLLPLDLRDELTKASDEHVQRFWRAVNQDFIPALKAHDAVRADKSLEAISASYDAHRAVVDRIVEGADRFSKQVEKDAGSDSVFYQTLMYASAALIFLGTFIGIWLLRRKAGDPLVLLAGHMDCLGRGEFEAHTPCSDRSDEIGDMAKALLIFKENGKALRSAQSLAVEEARRNETAEAKRRAESERANLERQEALSALAAGLERLASKDLTVRIQGELSGEYQRLKNDFNNAMTQLEAAISSVVGGAQSILVATGEVVGAANDLSTRTEQQAAAIEETAAAVEEITRTITHSASAAAEANKLVGTTKVGAEKSGVVVRGAVGAMGRIEESSRNISEIIGSIDEIAFQTNLLALNAGVEAARAGDSGRGFAVVASEVRALAQRAAEAARQIKGLITSSSVEIEQGVELVRPAGEALTKIVGDVAEIDRLVAEIATGAGEQARTMTEVNSAVTQMDQNTQKNAAMVEETTAACHKLRKEAEELSRVTRQFQVSADFGARNAAPAQTRSPAAAPKVRLLSAGGAAPKQMAHAEADDWREF